MPGLAPVLGILLCAGDLLAQRPPNLPPVPVPAENPITAQKAVLGKILFWDEQLSANNRVACATCHSPLAGGSDRRFAANPGRDQIFNNQDDIQGSPGVPHADTANKAVRDAIYAFTEQVTSRTAPTAIGAAFFGELFWDGRARSTFRDPVGGQVLIASGGALENQAVGPVLNSGEMAHDARTWTQITDKLATVRPLALASNLPGDIQAALTATPTYAGLFQAAFGDAAITAARVAFAIATYERTLVPDQTPWDRFNNGDPLALTPNQQQGQNLFAGVARCGQCHTPPLFSDQSYRFIGVRQANDDLGRQTVTNLAADAGKMKVPTLRGAALKSRFSHVGQFPTLNAMIGGFYNNPPPPLPNRDPLIAPIGLNQQQVNQIVDFLGALVDPRVAAGTGPFSRPTLFTETNPLGANRYGAGSPGTLGMVPMLLGDVPLAVGNPDFKVVLTNGLGGAAATLALSALRAAPNSSIFGVPVHVDFGPALWLGLVLNGIGPAGGFATHVLPVPNLAALRGADLFGQWFVIDPGAPMNLAATSGASWRVL